MATSSQPILLRRIRQLTWVMIVGLAISGLTAIPLETEMNILVSIVGAEGKNSAETSGLTHWLLKVNEGLRGTNAKWPFLAYGTDWLAFAHLMIALVFVGALRDPVRNRWLFDFGLLACFCVIPWALVVGGLRGIPFYWRLIDCSFGICGAIPLWYARRATLQLETELIRKQDN